jgi:hypothetical protein
MSSDLSTANVTEVESIGDDLLTTAPSIRERLKISRRENVEEITNAGYNCECPIHSIGNDYYRIFQMIISLILIPLIIMYLLLTCVTFPVAYSESLQIVQKVVGILTLSVITSSVLARIAFWEI